MPPRKRARTTNQASHAHGRGGAEAHALSSEAASERIRLAQSGDGILLITCDAAGDGKSSGIAGVLREIGACQSGHDRWSCVTAWLSWDHSTAAETEAIALALRTAAMQVDADRRQEVLVLSDCSGARKAFTDADCRVRREFECGDHAADALRKCSDAGSKVYISGVKSTHSKYDGFFDHAAADQIAAAARFQSGLRVLHAEVPSLQRADLDWLSHPPEKVKSGGSGIRKVRLRNRLKRECGLDLD
mmetsp:Transcript_36214/g.77227  ORF Transcript_36214/g.77227 Transcript_36214/m.77227 type:complete len:246 (+) Transcript_36214:197-934(+)